MRERIFWIGAVLVAGLIVSSPLVAQRRPTVAEADAFMAQRQEGRFVIVNGTPDLARNIMLLDTATGESWVSCTGRGVSGWCKQPRFEEAARADSADPLLGKAYEPGEVKRLP